MLQLTEKEKELHELKHALEAKENAYNMLASKYEGEKLALARMEVHWGMGQHGTTHNLCCAMYRRPS